MAIKLLHPGHEALVLSITEGKRDLVKFDVKHHARLGDGAQGQWRGVTLHLGLHRHRLQDIVMVLHGYVNRDERYKAHHKAFYM